MLFFREPKVILTLIVFWFFNDLKVTDLKRNNYRKLLFSKNEMFQSRSKSWNLPGAGAGNVKNGRLLHITLKNSQRKMIDMRIFHHCAVTKIYKTDPFLRKISSLCPSSSKHNFKVWLWIRILFLRAVLKPNSHLAKRTF